MGTKAPENNATQKQFEDPTDDQVAQFQRENPDGIMTVETSVGVFVVKGVRRAMWKQYVNSLAEPGKKGDALDFLAHAGRVYPNADTFGDLIERFPALVSSFIEPISALSGQQVAAEEKS